MSYNLLFDIGNVIIDVDFELTINKVADDCSVPRQSITTNVLELKDELETGLIDADEYLDQVIEKIGYSGEKAFLKHAFQDVFEPNVPMIDLIVEESKKGTPLYLLSNTNDIHIPFLFEHYEVFHLFDQAIYSHEVKLMKPDPEIYKVTAEQLAIDPATTIYIDDLPDNIAAGKDFGFQSILYDIKDHQAFAMEFETLRTAISG